MCRQSSPGGRTTKGVGKATLYTQDRGWRVFHHELPMEEDQYNKLTTGTKIRVTGSKGGVGRRNRNHERYAG